MADNTELNPGTGGDTMATDDIGGIKFPRGKIVLGANNANDGDVCKTNPLPVGGNTVKDGSGTQYALLVDSDGRLQVDVASDSTTIETLLAEINTAQQGILFSSGLIYTSVGLMDNAIYTEGDNDATITGQAILFEANTTTHDIRCPSSDYPLPVIANCVQEGIWNIRNQDGIGNALTSKELGTDRAITVCVLDDTGTQVTRFGGESEYTEGDTDATITGLAVMFEDAGNTLRCPSTTYPLPVTVTAQVPGVTATSLGKEEDAQHTTGATGVMMLSVYRTSEGQLAGLNNDYAPLLTDDDGRLYTTGGQQYVEGDTDATIRGTAIMFEVGTNTLQCPSTTYPLPVVSPDGMLDRTDKLLNDTTELTPKFQDFQVASSGDNTVILAVADKKIRVLSYVMSAAGAVTARFESGASGAARSGQMTMATGIPFSSGYNPLGHFETAVNTLLNLELSDAVSVAGHITYVEV